jgi:crotonobetainyl-CoA:carnitine CoA-transferase CaiB-like acyl-CoA transferase
MGDHVCSLTAVSGILAALVERGRTGRGRLVEASLLRAGVYAIASDMSVQLHFGKLASTKSRHQSLNPLGNFFRTADDRWLCLVPRTGKGGDWPQVCRALGRPELIDDPRFANGRSRRQHAAELVDVLDAAFAALSFAEIAPRLDAEDLVWSPLQTPGEVAADPQAEAAGCFVDIPGAAGVHRSVASPARFPGADDGPKGRAPELGEHTEAVLRELGLDDDAVAALRPERAAA